jgi:hypothetical protein
MLLDRDHHAPPLVTAIRSCAPQVRVSVTSGPSTFFTPTLAFVDQAIPDLQVHRQDARHADRHRRGGGQQR